MATQPQPFRVVFGPFEVNAAAGELRKGGLRLRLSGQPFQILLELLAHPGEVVTRERLREQIWKEGTFVDFEHGLNAAVNKLRRALGDSAEDPRYVETVPGYGYRFIGNVEHRLSPPSAISPAAQPAADRSGQPLQVLRHAPGQPNRQAVDAGLSTARWRWIAAVAACVATACGLVWRLHGPQTVMPPARLARLTNDAGISGQPALSRDGKLLAYSSDGGLDGAWDLYIKQVAGGQPIRLTSDGSDNTTPDFSPDGSRIVFQSSRDGGGIYEIPAFGGEARLLARGGLNPRYSPDGSQVAYWIGTQNVAGSVPGIGSVWVVPEAGGQPRRVGANFTTAGFPIWSPDGSHLLISGYTSAKAFDPSAIDWWVLATNGGGAIRTGAYDAMIRGGAPVTVYRKAVPGCWLASRDAVIFSIPGSDPNNLWEIGISQRTGALNGVLRRLTTGPGNQAQPSCTSGGALAFASTDRKVDIWLLPFDLDGGMPTGTLERTGQSPADRNYPSLSSNGRSLTFASNQSGEVNIWTRELASGKESIVGRSTFMQKYPVSSPSGTRVAFSVYEKDKRVVYISEPGGAPEKLCEGCLRATDWSRDEKTLLVFGGNPYQIDVVDVASHRVSVLLKHPAYNLLYGRFSPDNRWVSFTVRTEASRGRIMIAPTGVQGPALESAWIAISEVGAEDYANWSPDGKTLYFTSGKDGHDCLWGQRIEASSGRPVGDAFAA